MMAIAIEAVPQVTLRKPVTTRGNLWFHRHRPRRARGDRCNDRGSRGKARLHALEHELHHEDLQRSTVSAAILHEAAQDEVPADEDDVQIGRAHV